MSDFSVIGKPIALVDSAGKTTGAGRYTDDLSLPGMLIGKILHSPHPHAKIKRIDASRALAMDGVVTVVTGPDAHLAEDANLEPGELGLHEVASLLQAGNRRDALLGRLDRFVRRRLGRVLEAGHGDRRAGNHGLRLIHDRDLQRAVALRLGRRRSRLRERGPCDAQERDAKSAKADA